ncbi:MAG TPA: cell division protein ZapE [Burkholderiales bacterium]|nr:cell division protein ZapE [Burkholderiales bacterium]
MGDGGPDTRAPRVAEGEKLSPLEIYRRALGKRGFASDPAQQRAVERLQRLYEEWSTYKARRSNALRRLVVHPPLPRGVYLWGGVGRGKSFLMDSFFLSLPLVRKRRVHFHHFMRDVHRELQELKGREDPLDALAARIAKRYRLICFDEMQVNDIADAMIIGRLLQRTMELGVVYCMTSNYAPEELYKNGLKRENFLPAIRLLQERLDVVQVDGGIDYRKRMLEKVRMYHTPLGPESDRLLMEAFRTIAEVEEEFHELDVEGRVIPYRHRAGGVVWFEFEVICGWGRSQHDYLDLSKRFHTVIVANVPQMGLAAAEAARRFTLLVDVFYDNRVKLVVSAEVPPERLLRLEEDPADARLRAMVFEFQRTASRLQEMQSREYLAEHRRIPAPEAPGAVPI